MTTPVSYVELNSPDLEAATSFVRKVLGWEPLDALRNASSLPAARSSSSPSRCRESAGGATSPTRRGC